MSSIIKWIYLFTNEFVYFHYFCLLFLFDYFVYDEWKIDKLDFSVFQGYIQPRFHFFLQDYAIIYNINCNFKCLFQILINNFEVLKTVKIWPIPTAWLKGYLWSEWPLVQARSLWSTRTICGHFHLHYIFVLILEKTLKRLLLIIFSLSIGFFKIYPTKFLVIFL